MLWYKVFDALRHTMMHRMDIQSWVCHNDRAPLVEISILVLEDVLDKPLAFYVAHIIE